MPRAMSNQLNDKEKRVLAAFPTDKDDKGFQYVALSDLAGKAFNKRGIAPKTKGNSWVRNSMRKLLALKLVQMKGARTGLYRLTGTVPPESKAKVEGEQEEASKNGVKKAAKKKSKAKKPKVKAKVKGKGKGKGKEPADDEKQDEKGTSAESSGNGQADAEDSGRDDSDDDDDDDEDASEQTAE